tara:strand:+ start:234 stop:593 length:360 start_codon:yes stop_codon:yes gene_type:complete
MAHYAKVKDGIVVQVIVAEENFFKTFVDDSPGEWIQTSYNTLGGKHLLGGKPLRKNYAAVGYSYDKEKDAFIPPKRYDSWVLNKDTCLWEPPVAMPDDGKFYDWDESAKGWQLVEVAND